jgi:hypothetical protein
MKVKKIKHPSIFGYLLEPKYRKLVSFLKFFFEFWRLQIPKITSLFHFQASVSLFGKI